MNTLLKSLLLGTSLIATTASAQLSTNPDKFLGNITTRGGVNPSGYDFANYWNQITCENESKWASVEGNNNNFNWGGADNAYNYARQHNFPFKFHALVWGSQYPSWIESLTPAQRYREIVQWMDAAKQHFPNLQLIDVVNEAIDGHQAGTHYFIEALGGTGSTGYDWIVKAFELAHERWPDAILIYNDFNTFQWNTDQFIDLVKTLRDAGAPIDAYGCQSHDLTDCSLSTFKSSMDRIQNSLKMPMYSTEYDIGTSNDSQQEQRYKEQIPYMWEKDYCAGITLWGWIYGATWTTDGNSGIIRNGQERPAMTWLRQYMASDKAKNAKSPFPGMKKEASIYIRPAMYRCEVNSENTIYIDAKMRTKTIDHIDFYVNNTKVETLTEAPYVVKYTPTRIASVTLKAVVTTTDGTVYERMGGFRVNQKRSPFKDVIELPGTIEAENFDVAGEGVTFHDTDSRDEGGTGYRSNGGGVDIVRGNGGYAIGYTSAGEWLEYSVDVKEAGIYDYEAWASSGSEGSSFSICLADSGKVQTLAGPIAVPCLTSGNWDTYSSLTGHFSMPLTEGRHIIRIEITGSQCNIDKIVCKLKVYDPRSAFNDSIPNLPGTIEAENFDHGGDGFTFHDIDDVDQGKTGYRTDNEGVDILVGNGGYVIGNTADGEWLEYSVNVTQAGKYQALVYYSGTQTGQLTISVWDGDELKPLKLSSMAASGSMNSYKSSRMVLAGELDEGVHVLRFTIDQGAYNIDRIRFTCTKPSAIDDVNADVSGKHGWWTVSGQRLDKQPTTSGVYINNGKKIIIK